MIDVVHVDELEEAPTEPAIYFAEVIILGKLLEHVKDGGDVAYVRCYLPPTEFMAMAERMRAPLEQDGPTGPIYIELTSPAGNVRCQARVGLQKYEVVFEFGVR